MPDIITRTKSLLSTTAPHWISLVESLSTEMLTRPASSGEWSAVDCLNHLLDTESTVFPVRLHVFLEGGERFPGFDPDSEGTDRSQWTPAQLAAEFARYRTENLALLEQVTPAHLQRTAVHTALGPVTLEDMLNQWAAHDLNHTVQGERAIMQAFIQGSGPWRHYFIDHDLAAKQALAE
ncbi:MAG: DinB family protein [Chloroflexota bacterium]